MRGQAARDRMLMCAVVLACAGVSAGCSPSRDVESLFAPDDVGALVVNALLIVNRPLPSVIVTRALFPGVPYSLDTAGERGAIVEVHDLSSGVAFPYDATEQAGVYTPRTPEVVLPNTRYGLRVTTDKGEIVTSTTTTPSALKVDAWLLLDDTGQIVHSQLATFDALGDSVYFAPENQLVFGEGLLEARLRPADAVGYQLGSFSLDPDSEPLDEPGVFEEGEDTPRQDASPALEVRDGNLGIPWFMVSYEGRYKIRLLALDTNSIDYLRSLPEDDGLNFGGTLGGGFERPLFHVEGGIGLFGSASSDSVGFFVYP